MLANKDCKPSKNGSEITEQNRPVDFAKSVTCGIFNQSTVSVIFMLRYFSVLNFVYQFCSPWSLFCPQVFKCLDWQLLMESQLLIKLLHIYCINGNLCCEI